jgi:plasmid stabilization system protein ParE
LKPYQGQIAPAAAAHIQKQTQYIGRFSPANAMQWNARLRAALSQIGESPGHAIDESAKRATKKNVRTTNFEKTFLIYYIVDEQAHIVEILDVRHGARKSRFERE